MLDSPEARLILGEVQVALKAGIAPGFQQAVAANAVALSLREENLSAAAARAEQSRLCALLGSEGSLADLNAALALGLREGTIDAASRDLTEHLILTTVEKMRVDQPCYPAFQAWSQETGG